jgi:hypothetical protein
LRSSEEAQCGPAQFPHLGGDRGLPDDHDEQACHVVGAVAVLSPRVEEVSVLEDADGVAHREHVVE